jgi:hypothetical protein
VLASCEQPVSYAKIGSPENLKITPYTGANLLTWDLVVDASSFEVYRKEKAPDGDWSVYKELTGNPTNVSYLDVIGHDNVLVDGYKYEYKVVAKQDVGNVGSNASTKEYTAEALQFPAAGTALDATISAPVITVDNVYGRATLTWTGTGVDNPAITYDLTRSSGGSSWTRQGVANVATANISNGGYIDARIFATFANSTYYPASAAVYVEPVAYSVQHLDSITASITSAVVSGRTVTLTYNKVPDATAYILERAVQTAGNTPQQLSYAEITPTTPAGTPVETATTISVVDTLPTDGDNYYYRLFVRTAAGIRNASIS